MVIEIKRRAMNTIEAAAAYVEGLNTVGSGERWMENIVEEIYRIASSKAKFVFCKNASLAKFKYRCYSYKGWVIAFRISDAKFEVCRFIWGKKLV
ncbi:MAG: hypothetical protein JWO06_1265 [Bacteroidota bacterium]|nr:hypothetical protein [Bacteroidota bacterium]